MAEWNVGVWPRLGKLAGFWLALAALSISAKCIGVTVADDTLLTGKFERNSARVAAVGAVIAFGGSMLGLKAQPQAGSS